MAPKNKIILHNEIYQDLADKFYIHLMELGYNPKSNKSRYYNLCEFLCWLEQEHKQDLEQLRAVDIQNYYYRLKIRPNRRFAGILSPKSVHSHMQVVDRFFIFLEQQKIIKTNPCSALHFPYPKEKPLARHILTREEIQCLYQAASNHRERAILSLAYGCGLRAGEMQNCNLSDIRFQDKILIVVKGKGNKRRIVPLSKGVIANLSDYYHIDREELKQYPNHTLKDPAFMLNSKGRRMMQYTFNKYLKRIIERTGNEQLKNKQISIHSLRHSIASHLLEQGVKVEQVRLFLGHSQLETTQMYTHVSCQQLAVLSQHL